MIADGTRPVKGRPLTEAEKDERGRLGASMMALVMTAAMLYVGLCEAGVLP